MEDDAPITLPTDAPNTTIENALKNARSSTYSSKLAVKPGKMLGDFITNAKLGSGRFAVVWGAYETERVHGYVGGAETAGSGTLCRINDRPVAIKVYRSGRTNMEYWRNEVKIFNLLNERAGMLNVKIPNVIEYFGTFAHVSFDDLLEPNVHPCIVFGRAGDSVSRLIKHCAKDLGAGIPIECVKKITRDVLRGLAFIHESGLIHTDIKPSNFMIDRKIEEVVGLDFNVLIGDLGSSTPANDLFSKHVGTVEYLAPELLLDHDYTSAIDIWATFASCFEMITGDQLFDVYHENQITYGSDVDLEGLEGLINNDVSSDSVPELVCAMNSPGGKTCDGCDGCCGMDTNCSEGSVRDDSDDSSGSEDSEQVELSNYRHLLLIEKVIGPAPKGFWKVARKYYNSRGKLKNNPKVDPISISKLLDMNYNLDETANKTLEAFLLTGLRYEPGNRITADAALKHPWLQ